MIRIDVPAIVAGESVSYNRDCDELKNRFRVYGCFNWIDLCNDGNAVVRVLLDGNMNRSIDSTCHDRITEAEFVEFVVVNTGTTDLALGEATVYLGYKVNENKHHFLIDRFLGGIATR